MKLHNQGDIRYVTGDSLNSDKVTHAFFMRYGGISPYPYNSLNFGSTVGDEPINVTENKQRAFRSLGLNYGMVYDVWQVHSTTVVVASGPRLPGIPHEKADIILTDHSDVVLLMRFADCVPMLFYDQYRRVIGIAHAGWQGTLKGVAKEAVQALREKFKSNPEDLIVVIGPSIGPDHYQIGADVAGKVVDAFGDNASRVLQHDYGFVYLNLWLANRIQLEETGVSQIESMDICTACHVDDWYSHRAQHGKTGRFGALIALKE